MKTIVSIFGLMALLIMGGCSDSDDDTAAQPAPPDTASRSAARADDVIKGMSLDQKIQQIAINPMPNTDLPGCEFQPLGRHIEGIPELKIPTFRFANGGTGIRGGDCLPEPTATGVPSSMAAAATFDPQLNFEWGQVLSRMKSAAGPTTRCGGRPSTWPEPRTAVATTNTWAKTRTWPA